VKEDPDYFSWPFVFVLKLGPMEEMEESEYWRKFLELWNPQNEWMQ
jgi:hypothetical protein